MRKSYVLIIFILLGGLLFINRQKIKTFFNPTPTPINKKTEKEDTNYKNCELITISSSNNETQKAYFYRSNLQDKQPLVISLHTWGGTYKQEDSVLTLIKQKNWNYIHPDYGGQQWLKNSCCFDASIQYIDEAIDYAINNCNVDTSKIIIIGKSGGGSGVLATLLKSKYINLHYMCWSPITDYISWHKEVQQNEDLKKRYYEKIMLGTGSVKTLDTANAKLKSPLYFDFKKVKKRNFKTLCMYVGIKDGLDGWSTSISQPIRFYNKLLQELGCKDSLLYISAKEHQRLLKEREKISDSKNEKLGTRRIVFTKSYETIKILFFDGGHEILLNAVDKEFNHYDN